jgi:hypothetical protein
MTRQEAMEAIREFLRLGGPPPRLAMGTLCAPMTVTDAMTVPEVRELSMEALSALLMFAALGYSKAEKSLRERLAPFLAAMKEEDR